MAAAGYGVGARPDHAAGGRVGPAAGIRRRARNPGRERAVPAPIGGSGRRSEGSEVLADQEPKGLRVQVANARAVPLAADVDLDEAAPITHGGVGAAASASRRSGSAERLALRRSMQASEVTMARFQEALKETRPSVTPETEGEYERILQT